MGVRAIGTGCTMPVIAVSCPRRLTEVKECRKGNSGEV